MKIYLASSWRNPTQPAVVELLRSWGYDVYDFRNPPQKVGFGWKQIDHAWRSWSARGFIEGLEHPFAQAGFESDMKALRECDVCVLLLPCGRSAHLELGWSAGANKKTLVMLDDPLSEPELMYLMNTSICATPQEMTETLARWYGEWKNAQNP